MGVQMKWLFLAGLLGQMPFEGFSLAAEPVGTAVVDAEYNRLADRLARLAKKGHWTGAERVYRQLSQLGRPLAHPELLTCAEVERRAGNMQATYDCLRQAAKVEGTREVIDWLVSLEEQTGRVRIVLRDGESPELVPAAPLFLPEQQAALSLANQRLREQRNFEGRLPVGRYSLGPEEFRVQSAEATQVGPASDPAGAR